MSDNWLIIGRGFNGWHAAKKDCTSSGGSLEPMKWWAGGMTKGYLENAAEGALVYDASEADPEQFTKLVVSGPMVDCGLDPFGVDRFNAKDRQTAAMMVPGLGGSFKALALMAQSESFSGLDRVGIGIFEGLLRSVKGCKVGHVVNGKIVWD